MSYFIIKGIDGREKFIILGPASDLYGVDAFTGVINIIIKEGKEAKGIRLLIGLNLKFLE